MQAGLQNLLNYGQTAISGGIPGMPPQLQGVMPGMAMATTPTALGVRWDTINIIMAVATGLGFILGLVLFIVGSRERTEEGCSSRKQNILLAGMFFFIIMFTPLTVLYYRRHGPPSK